MGHRGFEGFRFEARSAADGWPRRDWGGHPGGRGPGHRGGPPPWLAMMFGAEGGPRGPHGPRGPRARRGDVRWAILDVLGTGPLNGYQVIQQISERTNGAWRASPGSVYPTMQQLEDEELIEPAEGKTMRLTDAGRSHLADHAADVQAVWEPFLDGAKDADSSDFSTLKPEIGQVMGAVWQIVTVGSDAQREQAVRVLVETRKKLYGILADGE